jgi:transposase
MRFSEGCGGGVFGVNQAQIDGGQRPGVTSEDKRRIAELERENRELRRANEILKTASAFMR